MTDNRGRLSNRTHGVLSLLAVAGALLALLAHDNLLLLICWLYAIRSWAVLYFCMLLWLDDQEEAARNQ